MPLLHHIGARIGRVSFDFVEALGRLDIDWLIASAPPVSEYLFAFLAVTTTELVDRSALRADLLSHPL